MALPEIKHGNNFTYGDYVNWPDEERWELINGFAYNMSPSPSRKHQRLSREFVRLIVNFLVDKPCEVYYAPFDVRLPEDDEDDKNVKTVVQPDIVVVCDSNKLDDKGCRGAPDIIIEILSPATSSKDMKIKLSLYERHGVKEYWIVHPIDQVVMIFKLGKDKMYGKPDVYTAEDKIKTTLLQGLEIYLSEIFKE